nr:DnaJ family domain-containing protein [Thalassobacillus pellis]
MIGDILEQSGEKDNYQGKGKGAPLPLDYTKRDLYQNFQKTAKDAGFLPPWLKLQKEISRLIHTCKTENDIEIINDKIRKYNRLCPTQLQKYLVSKENLEKAKERW